MIPVSWNENSQINDGVHYQSWFISPVRGLPELEANMASRYGRHPLIGGVTRDGATILLLTKILGGSENWLRALFNGEDEVPKLLTVTDNDGSNLRYIRALCTRFTQSAEPGVFVATLRVDNEVRWRGVTPTNYEWNITGDGQTISIINGAFGDNDDAYPIITATPRAYGSGQNPNRLFAAIRWPANQPGDQYPTNITDGDLDTRIAESDFYSATGDDIRVIVDGQEVDYWLDDINSDSTSIWVNIEWQAGQATTLGAALGAGSVAAIQVTSSIDDFPSAGLLQIGNELLAYSGKNNSLRTFTGITRGARLSSAATHDAGDPVYWIQHDIWIEYGSSEFEAITPDDSKKPMFDLATSTNTSWNYLNFFEEGAERAGAWAFSNEKWTQRYGGNQFSAANPYGELGIADNVDTGNVQQLTGYWSLYNPCGILSANFQSGERWIGRNDHFDASVRSSVNGASYTKHYTLPSGTVESWVSWSQNVSLVTGARYVFLWLAGKAKAIKKIRVEASQVTVALNSSQTPVVTLLPAGATYRLDARLTNETTGDAIDIHFALDLNESLEINTDTAEVTYLVDGSSQFAAVDMVGDARHHMLRLVPGENILRWNEPGIEEVDVAIEFERRYFA